MKSILLKNLLLKKTYIFSLVILIASSYGITQAATVTIKVKSGNQKVRNANVCLGDSSNKSKYGYQSTNNQGEAVFENVPATQVKATVSKSGFYGVQREFFASQNAYELIILGLPPYNNTSL
jgi:hypothetical protein